MRTIILIALSCAIIRITHAAEYVRLTVDQALALTLAAATLKNHNPPRTYSLEHSGYSNEQINSLRFINFTMVYPSRTGLPAGEYDGSNGYVVDFYTGDVFQPPSRNLCAYPNQPFDEVKTKKLAQLQKEVRRTLGLTRAAYQRLRTQKPGCKGLKVPASLLQAPNSEEIWSKPDYSASSLK